MVRRGVANGKAEIPIAGVALPAHHRYASLAIGLQLCTCMGYMHPTFAFHISHVALPRTGPLYSFKFKFASRAAESESNDIVREGDIDSESRIR